MNNALHFATGNDATETPQDFFEMLRAEFAIAADMAALRNNRKVDNYYGPDHEDVRRRDCLTIDWPRSAVWLNPPYSEPEHSCTRKKDGTLACKKKRCATRGYHLDTYRPGCIDFVAKAAEESRKGTTVVLLLASRTDNEVFHAYIWDARTNAPREGVELRFVPGRLTFVGAENNAPFPSMVVIFHAVAQ